MLLRLTRPIRETVVIHMKQPDAALLWNLSDGALGIVPYGSGSDFQQHPIGTGPFRFVSQELDKEVVLERNPLSWQAVPKISRLRFEVIPDEMTRALALRKGSADVASNALSPDMIWSMRNDKKLKRGGVAGNHRAISHLQFARSTLTGFQGARGDCVRGESAVNYFHIVTRHGSTG